MLLRRVVLDTNVVISGLCFKGPPSKIIELALSRKIAVFTSASLQSEFVSVMTLKFPHLAEAIAETMSELSRIWRVIPNRALPRLSVIAEDPDDDRVLECAAAVRSDCIVSGDKHLLKLKTFREIPIFAPAEFLSRFKSPSR